MGRHGRARHGEAPPSHWTHVVAGLPWITIVLVLVLVAASVSVLRPNRYAAEATLEATDAAAAGRVAAELADPGLAERVESEIELGEDYAGSLELAIHRGDLAVQVHVEALAPDPRLAALAADTAAGLMTRDGGEDLSAARPAQVPTEPTRDRGLGWIWLALVALIAAVWMEGAHRIWLRDHPTSEVEPDPAAEARR